MWTRRRNKHWVGPVIAPAAVKAFLDRDLADLSWVKECDKNDLLHELLELHKGANGFSFHTQPFLHQLACTLLGTIFRWFLFLLDMGAGKTKIILDILYFLILNGKVERALILVPSPVNTEGWVDQIKEHRPELKYVRLIGSQLARAELIGSKADIFLLNYDGLQVFMTDLVKGGRQIDRKMARDFASLFDFVVFDESHLVGNKISLRFRMCSILSKACEYRYALTGTPFGRNPEKLWAQFFLVDHGETLGTTLGMFRAAFFTAKENYFGGIDYKFNPAMEPQLHRVLQNRSIRYKDTEFSDVPKIRYIPHRLTFGMDAEKYYGKVLEELRQSRNVREMENSFLRMRQICSGFLSVRGEDEERIQVRFITNPKLQDLESVVDGLPEEEKLIIYHEFILGGDMICEMLSTKKLKWVRAGKKVKDQVGNMRKFLDNPAYRFYVINNKSGAASGTNPQKVCRNIYYYDSPSSPILRKQGERRITGGLRTAKHIVNIYDAIIVGGADELVRSFLKQGRDLFDALIEGKKEVLKP